MKLTLKDAVLSPDTQDSWSASCWTAVRHCRSVHPCCQMCLWCSRVFLSSGRPYHSLEAATQAPLGLADHRHQHRISPYTATFGVVRAAGLTRKWAPIWVCVSWHARPPQLLSSACLRCYWAQRTLQPSSSAGVLWMTAVAAWHASSGS